MRRALCLTFSFIHPIHAWLNGPLWARSVLPCPGQAGPELDAMRSQAYKLYARWQAEWARANDGGWTSAGEWYADLMHHSAHQHDTIIETHDHWLLNGLVHHVSSAFPSSP